MIVLSVEFTASVPIFLQCVFLLTRPERRSPANWFLFGVALVFLLLSTLNLFNIFGVFRTLPLTQSACGDIVAAFLAPLIYCHVSATLADRAWRGWRLWRHGAGPAFIFVLALAIAAFPDAAAGLAKGLPSPAGKPPGYALLYIVGRFLANHGIALAYLAVSSQAIEKARKGDALSESWLVRLSWLQVFVRLMWMIWLISFGQNLYMIASGFHAIPTLTAAIVLSYIAIYFALVWVGMQHGPVFLRPPEQILQGWIGPLAKYRKSAQTPEDAARIIGKLEQVMASRHLHRDPQLSLPSLAVAIGASPSAVSQAINQGLDLNFFDFVNRQRVEEAKSLLRRQDHADQAILDVALKVGFNSKSTFNAAFRKFVGMTPSDWRAKA